jgi:ABC-type branched-subunit amino acid transport system ATPase component
MALLEVDNLRHCFSGLVALDKVTFRVAEGQIKAIIGPNGAGKTTLFNIISGILRPTSGQIRFLGDSILGLAPHRIASRGVSRTFQNLSLFLRMTVLENVMIGRHSRTRKGFVHAALRLPGQRREEKAMQDSAMGCLSELGLTDVADVPAGSLSFGQRRMVELARALATEPKLLLLDEPASGLNTREKEGLAEIISRIHEKGVTILLVEHDMSLVMDISDDILVLHYGVPIAEGPPSAIRNHKDVVAVYLGGEFSDAAG